MLAVLQKLQLRDAVEHYMQEQKTFWKERNNS
jgi:hypothetical protein